MWLAGTPLGDDLIVDLVRRLQHIGAESTAQAVYSAALKRRPAAVLDSYDRRNILAALERDRPAGFDELHRVLLRQVGDRAGGFGAD